MQTRNASFEPMESRWLLSVAVPSYDGTGNNLLHADWGSSNEALLRLAAAAYGDGISDPAGATRPSARAISNLIVAQGDVDILNNRNLSAFVYAWGQFVDHDLDLTTNGDASDTMYITVPQDDQWFDPDGTGLMYIPFVRSIYAEGTGVSNSRQQMNTITAFLDGSMIYGSDETRALALRTGAGGMLKSSSGGLLPYNTLGLSNDTLGGPVDSYFVAGDVRANENIELTALQTLFVREHNRLAGLISAKNPRWTDEQVYQRARTIVIGELQAITYNEFLPALLGPLGMRAYTGYKPWVNPGISNEFSTAAFRVGHTIVGNDVEFLDDNGKEVADELPLSQAFFNPAVVAQTGIDPILKYLASDLAQEIDVHVVDPLRNFLFGPPGSGGLDLASLNIQRGRDHGLADYNSTRVALGLSAVTSFSQITSDPVVQQQLEAMYGSVNNIDLWVGGLAEDHVAGGSIGPTFRRIILDQFTRLRDGDRFWYQRNLSRDDLRMVEGTTLAGVIARNSGITNLQSNVFFFNPQIGGVAFADLNGDGILQSRERTLPGWRVNLIDADGNMVDSTLTGLLGQYRFSGMELGDYKITLQISTGWKLTTGPIVVSVTSGAKLGGFNFGVRPVGATPPPQSPSPHPPRRDLMIARINGDPLGGLRPGGTL